MIKDGTNPDGTPWTHVVCDATKIILNDKVTLIPGYVEIKGGEMFQHYSDDPNNGITPFLLDDKGKTIGANPEFKLGMLTNRVEFIRTEGPVPAPEGSPTDGHFLDLDTLHHFIMASATTPETGDIEQVETEGLPEPVETAPVSEEVVITDFSEVESTNEAPVEGSVSPTTSEELPTEPEAPAVEPETPSVEEAPTETPSADAPPPPVLTPEPEPAVTGDGEGPTAAREPEPVADTGTPEVGDVPAPEEVAAPEAPAIPDEAPTTPEIPAEGPTWNTDQNGIMRCSECMLTIGAVGDGEAHMNAHRGIVPAEPEAAPATDTMTTENSV